MGNPNLAPQERFTYRHYRTWPDSERWELIEGHAWSMSPAPRSSHQDLVCELFSRLKLFLKGKPCKAYIAPFDVLLPSGDQSEDEVDTVVQPDIVVYCDRSKLTEAGGRGEPELVMEILSPSTARKDQNEKLALYERHGVREYWVVDPAGKWLCVYRLVPGIAGPPRFDEGELREELRDYSPVASRVLEGFVVEPGELFAEMD
jgi:Uma2 family endonuclease